MIVNTRRRLDVTARTSPHYQALLRRLQLAASGSNTSCSAVGVTSCQNGEGVSTVAANLAIAAAGVSTNRVLLVDANVGRPSVGRTFRVNSAQGLQNALTRGELVSGSDGERIYDPLPGESPIFDCVVDSPISSLSVMLPGQLENGCRPSYDAGAIVELLDTLKHVFEFIVFDLPPANELTTCFSFASKLDGVLLVIEAERVPHDVAQRACRQLQDVNAQLMGVVYNKGRGGTQ